MSKGGSKFGRRSNWFKINFLLEEQQKANAKAHLSDNIQSIANAQQITAAAVAAAAASARNTEKMHPLTKPIPFFAQQPVSRRLVTFILNSTKF